MSTGRCLCGGVTFSLNAALAPIQICHCTQCRKAQGGPFATNAPVATADFQLHSGADLLAEYESSLGKRRFFCRQCGSPIYSKLDSLPNVVRIRAGLLDEPLKAELAFHIFAASKCSWMTINDELPKYEEGAK
jgi:hypothetical protein